MPAPEVTCGLLTHYFGTVIDKDNVSVNCSGADGISNWHIDIAADPAFTDIYMQSGSNSITVYNLVPGVTYYVRAQGRTTSDTTVADCEYTEYSYLSITLKEYGTLVTTAGLESSENTTNSGDVNDDGSIDISDATMVLTTYAYSAAGMDISNYTEAQLKASDIDGDNQSTISDATFILTYYAQTAAGMNPTWDDILNK